MRQLILNNTCGTCGKKAEKLFKYKESDKHGRCASCIVEGLKGSFGDKNDMMEIWKLETEKEILEHLRDVGQYDLKEIFNLIVVFGKYDVETEIEMALGSIRAVYNYNRIKEVTNQNAIHFKIVKGIGDTNRALFKCEDKFYTVNAYYHKCMDYEDWVLDASDLDVTEFDIRKHKAETVKEYHKMLTYNEELFDRLDLN